MSFIKKSTILLFIWQSVIYPRDMNYLDFEIIVNNDPYPANMFIHTMGSQPRYMAIIDSLINPSWFINSGPLGLDFKVNQNKLSYFNNYNKSWIILNEYMNETDTLECVNGYLADFHDIQLLANGGYLLQTYDSIYVDMSQIDPGGNTNALIIILIIQEFDSNKNLIFEWNAWEHMNIADYHNLNLTSNRIVWMHGNSIHIDLDSNILVSNRRSSEVIKIDRNNGAVIWYFGGPNNEFSITNDPYNGFSRQHDVRRIENGNILLFDNGNGHDPSISRAEILKNLSSPLPPNVFFTVEKSFNKLLDNTNLLITEASGTCLEAIACGVPVVLIKRKHGLYDNPLSNDIDKCLFKECSTIPELIDALNYYNQLNENQFQELQLQGRIVRKNYFEPITKEGTNRLRELGQMENHIHA